MYGSWPKSELDHINGVRTDNSIGNLRESNRFEQNQKLSTRSDNNSGIKGVSKRERDGKWKAAITIDGTYKFLGDFDTKSDAALALAIYKKEVLNA